MGLKKRNHLLTVSILEKALSNISEHTSTTANSELTNISQATQIHYINRRIQTDPVVSSFHEAGNIFKFKSVNAEETQTSFTSDSQSLATANTTVNECRPGSTNHSVQTSLAGIRKRRNKKCSSSIFSDIIQLAHHDDNSHSYFISRCCNCLQPLSKCTQPPPLRCFESVHSQTSASSFDQIKGILAHQCLSLPNEVVAKFIKSSPNYLKFQCKDSFHSASAYSIVSSSSTLNISHLDTSLQQSTHSSTITDNISACTLSRLDQSAQTTLLSFGNDFLSASTASSEVPSDHIILRPSYYGKLSTVRENEPACVNMFTQTSLSLQETPQNVPSSIPNACPDYAPHTYNSPATFHRKDARQPNLTPVMTNLAKNEITELSLLHAFPKVQLRVSNSLRPFRSKPHVRKHNFTPARTIQEESHVRSTPVLELGVNQSHIGSTPVLEFGVNQSHIGSTSTIQEMSQVNKSQLIPILRKYTEPEGCELHISTGLSNHTLSRVNGPIWSQSHTQSRASKSQITPVLKINLKPGNSRSTICPVKPITWKIPESQTTTYKTEINTSKIKPLLDVSFDEEINTAMVKPNEEITTDKMKPNEKITTDKMKPNEKITTDKIKHNKEITTGKMKPNEKITTDRMKPNEEITTDKMKPNIEITTDKMKPNKDITTDEMKPNKEITTGKMKPNKDITTNEMKPNKEITTDKMKPNKDITTDEMKPNKEITTGKMKPNKDIITNEMKPNKEITTDKMKLNKDITTDKMKPNKDITTDKMKPNKDITTDKMKPNKEITTGEMKPNKDITTDKMKPNKDITTDKMKPNKEITTDKMKPTHGKVQTFLSSRNVLLNSSKSFSKSTPGIIDSTHAEAIVQCVQDQPSSPAFLEETNPTLQKSQTICSFLPAGDKLGKVDNPPSQDRHAQSDTCFSHVNPYPLHLTKPHISQSVETHRISQYCQTEQFYFNSESPIVLSCSARPCVHWQGLSFQNHQLRPFTFQRQNLPHTHQLSLQKHHEPFDESFPNNGCRSMFSSSESIILPDYTYCLQDTPRLYGQPGATPQNSEIITRPQSVICYICGREYGTSSIGIHEKQCIVQWVHENEEMPLELRRPKPVKPNVSVEMACTAMESETDSYDIEAINSAAFTALQAQYVPCKFCGRTFLPKSLLVHAKSCNEYSKIRRKLFSQQVRCTEKVDSI